MLALFFRIEDLDIMATMIGHSAAALVISRTFQCKKMRFAVALMGIFCSIAPDFDVIAFKFGIPYSSVWGHRGISHSLFFAIILGFIAALVFVKITGFLTKSFLVLMITFFLIVVSHVLLDAITNGGLGVALFAPFDNTRYFLPWRPIPVAPIALSRVMQPRGLAILKFEFFYFLLPALLYIVGFASIKKIFFHIKMKRLSN